MKCNCSYGLHGSSVCLMCDSISPKFTLINLHSLDITISLT